MNDRDRIDALLDEIISLKEEIKLLKAALRSKKVE